MAHHRLPLELPSMAWVMGFVTERELLGRRPLPGRTIGHLICASDMSLIHQLSNHAEIHRMAGSGEDTICSCRTRHPVGQTHKQSHSTHIMGEYSRSDPGGEDFPRRVS